MYSSINSYEFSDFLWWFDNFSRLGFLAGAIWCIMKNRSLIKRHFHEIGMWIAAPVTVPYAIYGIYKLTQDNEFMDFLVNAKVEEATIAFFRQYSEYS